MSKYRLRKVLLSELDIVWKIIESAIEKRRVEGSNQWQDGYPNIDTIREDIAKGQAYAYEYIETGEILGYIAIIFEVEPAYNEIDGDWLSDNPYVVLHRLATKQANPADGTNLHRGMGTSLLEAVEDICLQGGRHTIKADTNYDNKAMLRVFEKLGYTYCGVVYLRGGARRAFQKLLF